MFNWLFKRSSQDRNNNESCIDSKSSNERAQFEETEQDLILIRDTLSQVLMGMADKIADLEAHLDQAEEQKSRLEVQLKKLNTQDDLTSEIKTLKDERGLILSGMFEAQEELERLMLAQNEFEKKNNVLNNRFDRLLKRYKNYVDFEQLEIVSFDIASQTPEIIWEMTSCFFSGTIFKKIKFKSFMKEGRAGIFIMSFTKAESYPTNLKQEATLFPELLRVDVEQQKLLQKIQSSHWRAFGAAVSAIDLTIKTNWRDHNLPGDFDPQFWSSSFQNLSRDFTRQPKVLRFESVKLKQELVNSDYEHLWFELFDVSYGQLALPKFEFRIGAAQVHPKEFSNYPKLEIPLVDGKLKPFESWYPESFDDFGDKFELRFDLLQNKFDLAALGKLSIFDRELIVSLIRILPSVLRSISADAKLKAHTLNKWNNFIDSVVKLMQSQYILKTLRKLI